MDNVADTAAEAQTDDAEMKEYLERFDRVKELNTKLAELSESASTIRTDQRRVQQLIAFTKKSVELNAELYGLLVAMNNVFAKSE